jgi:hypothetical protein
MWRYAACEIPQASVLKAVRLLRQITISTFRTLPARLCAATNSYKLSDGTLAQVFKRYQQKQQGV